MPSLQRAAPGPQSVGRGPSFYPVLGSLEGLGLEQPGRPMEGRGPTSSPRTISCGSLRHRHSGLLTQLPERHQGHHPCPHLVTSRGHCFKMVSDVSNNPSLACFIQNGDNCSPKSSRRCQQLGEQGPGQAPPARTCEPPLPSEQGADLWTSPLHSVQTRQPCASRVRLPPEGPPQRRREGQLPANPRP